MQPVTEGGQVPTFTRSWLALAAGLVVALALSGCEGLPWRDSPADAGQVVSGSTPATVPPSTPPSEPSLPVTSSSPDESLPAPEPQTPSAAAAQAPTGPPLIWDRLRDRFALTIPDNPRVDRKWQWFVAHPEYLERVQRRARPYLRYIVDQVEARGLPGELALLPVVESAYQPFAYSSGQASGIWQFIPSTGRHFGLKQTWWYDGRRDVIASTGAALDYLAQLSTEFDGDWELALAAYNTGSGNLRRAIRRNQKRGRPTDFWSLELPSETETYVPRLLAIARLIAEPKEAGITLADIPDIPYFSPVGTGGQVDLAMAADMAGLSTDELHALNPGYNRWATDPDGPHRLLVPVDCAEKLETGLASLAPEARVKWERYRISRGDSLSVIASSHHTTVEVLRQVNHLRGNRITAGKHLLIPVATRSLDQYAQSTEQRLAHTQGSPRGNRKIDYEVQPGDTLWDIARTYHVGFRELARWNSMAPADTLRPGRQLVVWKQQTSGSRTRIADLSRPGDRLSTLRYQVRRGDSLYKISQRFQVSIADLRQWNSLSSGKYLQPGQRLKVLVNVTEQSAL